MLDIKGRLAKGLAIVAVLAVAVLLIGYTSRSVFADPPTPTTPPTYALLNGGTIQQVANIIGITPKDVITQFQGGKTLAQIAQDKGVSKEKLVDTIVLPYKDQLDARVKYGYLTATRADDLLKTRKQQVEALVSQTIPETALAPYAEGEDDYDEYCPMHEADHETGMMGSGNGTGMMGDGYGSGMMGSGYGSGMMGGSSGWSGAGMMGGFGSDTRDSTAGSAPTIRGGFGGFGSGMMGRGWR